MFPRYLSNFSWIRLLYQTRVTQTYLLYYYFPLCWADSTKISAFTDFYQMEFVKRICIKRLSICLFMNSHKELHVSILSIILPLCCAPQVYFAIHIHGNPTFGRSLHLNLSHSHLLSHPIPLHFAITTIHPWLRLINIPGWKVFASRRTYKFSANATAKTTNYNSIALNWVVRLHCGRS